MKVGDESLKVRVERQIGASILSIETGELAKQAAGSCLVQYGETVVLAATASGGPRPGDFFPLTCDYRERVAAAGKFPGGFLKREGRPTTKETLTARLMDRPIRPLFPEGFRDEVQVQAFVMASDRQNDGDVLAMNGASAALCISPLPFQGPIGSVRLGCIDGEFVPFPTHDAAGRERPRPDRLGQQGIDPDDRGFRPRNARRPHGRGHRRRPTATSARSARCRKSWPRRSARSRSSTRSRRPTACSTRCEAKYYDAFRAAKQTEGKLARAEACAALKKQAVAELIPDPKAEGAITAEAFASAWEALETRVIRDQILTGTRTDGRDYTTLRPISCKVDLLPRVHGSAMFQRGETQALVTVTLGTGRDEQRVDGLVEEYSQKFMLHYYFPSFSVGECRPIRGPGPPRNRPRGVGRAERQARAARSRRLPLHDPHHLRHSGEQRIEFDGQRVRRRRWA